MPFVLFGVNLPEKLVEVRKEYLPLMAAPGLIERCHRALRLVRWGASFIQVALEVRHWFSGGVPSNKANAADCQSKVFCRAGDARRVGSTWCELCWWRVFVSAGCCV